MEREIKFRAWDKADGVSMKQETQKYLLLSSSLNYLERLIHKTIY